MTKMILGIGIPGSGKTTALKPFAEKYGYTYINADEIRQEISGDASIQTDMSQVWEEVHKRSAESLEKGETIVVDATFVKGYERRDFIAFARDHGAGRVEGICAAVPFEIASQRNAARERVVPLQALEKMQQNLQKDPPVVEDDFDAVFDVNEYQKLVRAEVQGNKKTLYKEFKPRLR